MRKRTIYSTMFLILLIIGSFLFIKIYENKSTVITSNVPGGETENYISYINNKYFYTFKYDPNSNLYLQELDSSDLSESSNVSLNINGTDGVFSVLVMSPVTQNLKDNDNLDYNELISLDLKSFAEKSHQKDLEIKNPNFPNKIVSALSKENLFGREVYTFEIKNDAPDLYGAKDHKIIILENNNYKMIINYPISNNDYLKTFNSFNFTK